MKRREDPLGLLLRRNVVAYDLPDGRVLNLPADAVQKYGAEKLARECGFDPGEPGPAIPVFQRGRRIGWMGATFDPLFTRSTSMFYDIRPNDFRRIGDQWVACPSICPGDFDAIPLFTWDREPAPEKTT